MKRYLTESFNQNTREQKAIQNPKLMNKNNPANEQNTN